MLTCVFKEGVEPGGAGRRAKHGAKPRGCPRSPSFFCEALFPGKQRCSEGGRHPGSWSLGSSQVHFPQVRVTGGVRGAVATTSSLPRQPGLLRNPALRVTRHPTSRSCSGPTGPSLPPHLCAPFPRADALRPQLRPAPSSRATFSEKSFWALPAVLPELGSEHRAPQPWARSSLSWAPSLTS